MGDHTARRATNLSQTTDSSPTNRPAPDPTGQADNRPLRRPSRLAPYQRGRQQYAAARGLAPERLSPQQRTDCCAWLADTLKVAPRTVQRYVAVLDAVAEIQRAFEDRQIRLVVAASLGRQSEEVQQAIAEAIRGGQHPMEAIRQHVGPERSVSDGVAITRFVARIYQANKALDGRDLGKVSATLRPREMETLQQAHQRMKELVAMHARTRRELAEAMADVPEAAKKPRY